MTKLCDNKSVGMLIWRDGKLLLIERKLFPFGIAPPAGHVDNKGSFENAAKEEVLEEVGLKSLEIKPIKEGSKDNKCGRKGGNYHYWKIYEVKTEGAIKPSMDETKQVGWFSLGEIRKLSRRTEKYIKGEISERSWQHTPGIETVWYEWLKELKII